MSRPSRAISPETRHLQEQASDPQASAWVSANAGSGKTTVLVRRVLRLLLAGVDPGRILCLTYTTAAASNMSNRLFDILSQWTRLSGSDLDAALTKQLGRPPESVERTRARRLFAQAIETPGGLKLQTIHAFCTRILQSTPFEAGVPAHFDIIGDTARRDEIEQAIGQVLGQASGDAPALKRSLDQIARWADDSRFRTIIDRAIACTDFLLGPDGLVRPLDAIEADIRAALGVDPELSEEGFCERALARCERVMPFTELAKAVMEHGKDKVRAGFEPAIRDWPALGAVERLDTLLHLLLTAKGEPSPRKVTIEATRSMPHGVDRQAELQALLANARNSLLAIRAAERSIALFTLARLILGIYTRRKRALAALDYEDLLVRTRNMLESGAAQWVLYKLDAGLDHLLVDEAQDTSADQWAILRALTGEFFAGEGPRATGSQRTIFAVGDEKQSIYGFQGAAPAEFGAQREHYRTADPSLRSIRLQVSFRSTRDIIEAVDLVFAQPDAFVGLTSDPTVAGTKHETNRRTEDDCGAVDLWELVEAEPANTDVVWTRPIDAPERNAPVQTLARRIALTIQDWTLRGFDDLGRPFQPGDALVLLPKRKAAFEAVVRALKNAGVPVAGMDRLMLSDHIAVQDMLAIGRAVLLPEDDLTLATALKTPVFGLDDEALMRLAFDRPGSLRDALRVQGNDPTFAPVHDRLASLEQLSRESGPFGFYATILSVMGGRRAMLSRLGAEAGDALDAFLQRALAFEQQEGPSLAGFIEAIASSTDQVKRDLAQPAGEVRVMTVHGAKGLEAPVVFIADIGADQTPQNSAGLIAVPYSSGNAVTAIPIWVPSKDRDCHATRHARDTIRQLATEEQHRLLYVAMTRAEDRLIVCGVQPGRESSLQGSWYRFVQQGLSASPDMGPITPGIEGFQRWRFKVSKPLPPAGLSGDGAASTLKKPAPPPLWLHEPVTPEHEPTPPLAPSRAMTAAGQEGRPADSPARQTALARGRFAHLLLQHLPGIAAEQRLRVAERLAARFATSLTGDDQAGLIAATLAVMSMPACAALFGPDGLAEVEIGGVIATHAGERRVQGRIDRLLITADRIILADFKTSLRAPRHRDEISADSLSQLAVYQALLSQLHPGKSMTPLLIYTSEPVLHEPSQEQIRRALAGITGL